MDVKFLLELFNWIIWINKKISKFLNFFYLICLNKFYNWKKINYIFKYVIMILNLIDVLLLYVND